MVSELCEFACIPNLVSERRGKRTVFRRVLIIKVGKVTVITQFESFSRSIKIPVRSNGSELP